MGPVDLFLFSKLWVSFICTIWYLYLFSFSYNLKLNHHLGNSWTLSNNWWNTAFSASCSAFTARSLVVLYVDDTRRSPSTALLQIRRALLQLLFPERPFHWLRHIAIAACLLFVVNMLVILVPNIRDIFGITGEESDGGCDFLSLVVQHSQSSRF